MTQELTAWQTMRVIASIGVTLQVTPEFLRTVAKHGEAMESLIQANERLRKRIDDLTRACMVAILTVIVSTASAVWMMMK